MIQDPNVEILIRKSIEPLNKQISMLQIELNGAKEQLAIPRVSGSADFFKDAQTFLKNQLPKDSEEQLLKYTKDKAYNENEFRLFKNMMQEAVGFTGTIVLLKHYL